MRTWEEDKRWSDIPVFAIDGRMTVPPSGNDRADDSPRTGEPFSNGK